MKEGGQGHVKMRPFLVSEVLELSVLRFTLYDKDFVLVVILGNARLSLSNEIALK